MGNAIGADPADKLAGLQIDLLQKYRQGQISLEEILWFLKMKKERRELLRRLEEETLYPKLLTPRLHFVRTVPVYGRHLSVTKSDFRTGRICIKQLSESFVRNFLPKIEENIRARDLRIHTLLERSRCIPIMIELGNTCDIVASTTTVSLAHFYDVLQNKQASGDFTSIAAFAEDVHGNIGVVEACGDALEHSWIIGADQLGFQGTLNAFDQVLSP